jgi:hypothetical protein
LVIQFELQLINISVANWNIWKSLESKMSDYAINFGIEEFDLEYDDENFIKKVSLRYESEIQLCRLQTEASLCAGRNGLEIDLISRKMLEYSSFEPSEKKIKFLFKLIDPTPENWFKFLDSEPHIQKLAEDANIIRDKVIYNQKDYSLTVEQKYPDTKSREILNSKINSYMGKIGLCQEIIEAIEFNDYKDDVIDLQLYKANKLMDQADQSLRKLSKM